MSGHAGSMLFIFGLKNRTKTVDSGQFTCPYEQARRRYRLEQGRRWVTLFFIPVIPLRRRGRWVQCTSCGTTYRPDVLSRAYR